MFNPSRLTLARKRRGLSKTKLAEALNVTQKAISDYEAGLYAPAEDVQHNLAKHLQFPLGFFYGPDLHEPTSETASFRSMSKMTAGQRDSALGAGALAFMLNDWIEEQFVLPAPDLPDLRGEDPESAAMILRQHWGIGERPIRNIVHLLESKGIRVYSLAENTVEVDAFSLWKEQTPFIFLNTLKSAERSRFDAAHELGHLILHRHIGPKDNTPVENPQTTEKQADMFASAFLMPRGSVLGSVPKFITPETLVQLKRQWIVSVAALAYRLHVLGLLTEWHYRTLCIEISQRGWRKNEPESAARETSQIIAMVLSALRKDGIYKTSLSEQLCLDPSELDKLIFGLALTSIEGAGIGKVHSTSRNHLSVIK
jgi:Zn-dependent peptidase ImmA (M78 family)/DNA-binding XRE family transcriptional regulator